MHARRFYVALLGSLLPLNAVGADTTTIPTTVVTASRLVQSTDQTLTPVSVVEREDIERLQANSVQDVLRGLPGVAITNNGGPGKTSSLFVRGTESDHVLVLIDGVKVGSASLGTFSFQDLPVEQIERIELVRGPRASLYGSEALGGVLHIFTKRGGGDLKPSARFTVGSRHSFDGSASLKGGGEQGWFNVTGSALTTRGINACRGSLVAGCFTIEPDRDGYRNQSVAARAGYRFDNGIEVDGNALLTSSDNEFDGGFQNESESRQALVGARVQFSPSELWDVALSGGHSRDEIDSFKDSVFASEFLTRRETLSWVNTIQVTDSHLLQLGADYQRDRVGGTTMFAENARRNLGMFAQFLGQFGAHSVEAAFRHDDNEQFGAANTGSAAWGWTVHPLFRVVASYATAFKAPSFNELYFPAFGNPNLDPEESRTAELGFSGAIGTARWSLNAFYTQIDDLITFSALTFAPENIGEARIRGLEAAVSGQFMGTDIAASFTLLDPRNRGGGANHDNWLPRRPRQSFRVDADRKFGHVTFGTTLQADGSRYDDLANTRRIGGFLTVDLRMRYQFNDAWSLQGRVENLFDRSYETASFFAQPGRGAFVTLRYQP